MNSTVETTTYRRRIVYIYKNYQRGFVLKFCALALGAMVIASGSVYLLSQDTITATYGYHHLSLKSTAEAILPELIVTNVVVLVCLLAATVATTLCCSHKIGGPLFRLGKSVEAIGDGDLQLRVTLRHGDQLREFAGQLNQMVLNLNGRVKEIQKGVRELKGRVEEGRLGMSDLAGEIEKLERTVSRVFKTE